MVASICRRLRTASICLLGVVASLSISASVPAGTAPARPASISAARPLPQAYDTTNLALTTPVSRSHASAPARLRPVLAAPSNSAAPRSTRRIFVEDTTHPSSDALKTARLQAPMQPYAPPRPASPALRSILPSDSNRQRAPKNSQNQPTLNDRQR